MHYLLQLIEIKEMNNLGKSKEVGQPPNAYVKNKAKGGANTLEGRSSEELFNEAIELYQRGVSGDGKSAQKAVDLFAHLRNQRHGDNVLDAYYGASNLLMGKFEKNPMNKGKWINQGLDIVDKAHKRDPDNTKIRILRGYGCYHLPVYFNRIGTTIEDFEYLLSRNQKEPGVISENLVRNITSDLETAYKTKKKIIPQIQNIAKNFTNSGKTSV